MSDNEQAEAMDNATLLGVRAGVKVILNLHRKTRDDRDALYAYGYAMGLADVLDLINGWLEDKPNESSGIRPRTGGEEVDVGEPLSLP